MTTRRTPSRRFFGFAAAGSLALALCVALPAAASPGPDPSPVPTPSPGHGEGGAARTRPSNPPANIGSSGGAHHAQPSGSSSGHGSSASDHAVPRGNSGPAFGRHRSYDGHYDGHYSHHGADATIYWGVWPWGGPWGWWGWWGNYPYGYGYGYYDPVPYYASRVRPSLGALDLDLRPETARVYLNGQPVGIADNFDGWPRYLWLEQGTYDLVFYHEGFETIARQYTVYPGVIIDVEDQMVPGDATPPEDLIAKSTARRDERLRRAAELRKAAEQAEPEWQERVRSERGESAEAGDSGEMAEPSSGPLDARAEPARLVLTVTPADAAIYLDGRFLGGADEIAARHGGIVVDPGKHEIEVVRPGYESKTESFTAETGEDVELTVELARGR